MTLNQNKENGSMFLDPGQREQRSQEKTMVQQANSSQKDPHSDLDFTTDLLAEPFPVPLALHGDTFTAITFPLFWWVMLQDVLPGFAGSFIEKVRKRTRTKKKKKKNWLEIFRLLKTSQRCWMGFHCGQVFLLATQHSENQTYHTVTDLQCCHAVLEKKKNTSLPQGWKQKISGFVFLKWSIKSSPSPVTKNPIGQPQEKQVLPPPNFTVSSMQWSVDQSSSDVGQTLVHPSDCQRGKPDPSACEALLLSSRARGFGLGHTILNRS